MLHGIVEFLGRQPAPPASAGDVAGTLRKVRELLRIAEQELHAVILACTRARQHRLATSTMTKPTIHLGARRGRAANVPSTDVDTGG